MADTRGAVKQTKPTSDEELAKSLPQGFVAAKDLDTLAAALRDSSYTPRTDDELRQQAQALYQNQYDAARLTAQQNYDTTAAALQNQLDQLDTSYARQTEAQQEANRQSLSNQDRYSLGRGMQRSTFNNATIGNLQIAGDKALNQIQQNRTAQESSIASQQALAKQQLQQNLAAADTQYQNNVIARILEMQDQDWQRQQQMDAQRNSLQMQLYQLQQADRKSSGYSGGGGGSYNSSSSSSTGGTTNNNTSSTPALDALGGRDYSTPGGTTTPAGTTTPTGMTTPSGALGIWHTLNSTARKVQTLTPNRGSTDGVGGGTQNLLNSIPTPIQNSSTRLRQNINDPRKNNIR